MKAAELMPFDAPSGAVVALIVGLANFLTILTVLRALAPRDLMAARARSHAKRRRELRAARLAPRRAPRERTIVAARNLIGRLKLDRGEEARKAGDLLAQAGWRSPDATAIFLTLRLACPLVVGLLAYAFAPAFVQELSGRLRLVIGGGGMLAGAYLPTLLLRNAITRRQQKIQKALPDALDLFVICAEAGLSLDAAVTRVGREMGQGADELADELGLTAIELGFLPNRRDALQNLTRRAPMPAIRALVNTLTQTEKYGTPLAQALRTLAAEFRDARLMKAEEKAARLPATLTVPMITFILPPLFVVLVGPAVVQALHALAK
ncbi:type II secretion system F family protein [Phenylobacterium sp.]|uniref:type II secretion system F family protein n=1 Tax=Phenylobacterium sp. TaxID=1871053 RepID=UPI0035B3B7F0